MCGQDNKRPTKVSVEEVRSLSPSRNSRPRYFSRDKNRGLQVIHRQRNSVILLGLESDSIVLVDPLPSLEKKNRSFTTCRKVPLSPAIGHVKSLSHVITPCLSRLVCGVIPVSLLLLPRFPFTSNPLISGFFVFSLWVDPKHLRVLPEDDKIQ